MFILMGVNLFSFRILLQALGVDNYGIYNVVGGVVVLFSFISAALNQSTQRYLSYYIGKNQENDISKIYSMSVNVHLIFGTGILIIAESVGLWIVFNVLNLPPNRGTEIFWLYQISIMTFIVSIIKSPLNSAIISFEKFGFYSYLSIFEAFVKLGGVYLLISVPADTRLIIYALIILIITVGCWGWAALYCKKNIQAIKYVPLWDKNLFKDLLAFNGWNMLGGISNITANQGLNMIFNVFCGVAVNAAMGICNQIFSTLSSFVSNFQTAFNPQITKSYAGGDRNEFFSFLFSTSRLSFCLMLCLGMPIIVCCGEIMKIWLGQVPQYAVPFTQLMLVFSLIDALSGPLWVSAQAAGNIKNYMLIMSGLIMLNLPASILILWLGFSPVYVILFRVILNLITHFVRIGYLSRLICFPAMKYIKEAMLPTTLSVVISFPLSFLIKQLTHGIEGTIFTCLFSILISAVTSYFIVLSNSERTYAISVIKKLKHKIVCE